MRLFIILFSLGLILTCSLSHADFQINGTLSPDGKYAARMVPALSGATDLSIIDVVSTEELLRIENVHPESRFAFSPDSQKFAIVDSKKVTVYLKERERASFSVIKTYDDGPKRYIAWAADSMHLIVQDTDLQIVLLNPFNANHRILRSSLTQITHSEFSDSTNRLTLYGIKHLANDTVVKEKEEWDLLRGESRTTTIETLPPSREGIQPQVAVVFDGPLKLSSTMDDGVLEFKKVDLSKSPPSSESGFIDYPEYSPWVGHFAVSSNGNGRNAAIIASKDKIALISLGSMLNQVHDLGKFLDPNEALVSVAIFSDLLNNRIAITTDRGKVGVLDLESGGRFEWLPIPEKGFSHLATLRFTPDGKTLSAIDPKPPGRSPEDHSVVRSWDLETAVLPTQKFESDKKLDRSHLDHLGTIEGLTEEHLSLIGGKAGAEALARQVRRILFSKAGNIQRNAKGHPDPLLTQAHLSQQVTEMVMSRAELLGNDSLTVGRQPSVSRAAKIIAHALIEALMRRQ